MKCEQCAARGGKMNTSQAVFRIATCILFMLAVAPTLVRSAPSFEFIPPYVSGAAYGSPTNPFERGQCTWYVFGRVLETSGSSLQFTRENNRGAELWAQLLSPEYRRTMAPEAGAIAVWKHKTIADFGHVAYVEGVYGNVVLFTEANFSVLGNYDGTIKASIITDFENSKGGKPWDFLGYVVPAASVSQAGGMPFSRGQVWNGTYRCRQGLTALSFRVSDVASKTAVYSDGLAYAVSAVFDFNFNNGEATGAFNLTGRYYPENRRAVFEPGSWIANPNGYQTVGMKGQVADDGRTFAGSIASFGCGDFSVTRD